MPVSTRRAEPGPSPPPSGGLTDVVYMVSAG